MEAAKKILILSANPKDTTRLRLDEEVREIEEGLQRSKNRGQFIIQPKLAVRLRDLRRAMLDNEPQIVHFCGHGEIDGLMVEDDHGNAILINPDALAGLFELFTDKVECALLNACYSEAQADAINKHIHYVIGMKHGITDKTALEFAIGFYDALGAGKSVEEAFKFGRNAIQLYDIPEDSIPVLKRNLDILLPTKTEVDHITESYQKLQQPTQEQVADLKRQIERLQQAQLKAERSRQRSKRKSVGLKTNVEKLFVDRIAYLDKLAEYTTNKETRLILIVGQGGIGKTALVAKFCEDIERIGYQIQPYEGLKAAPDVTPVRAIVYVNKKEMVSFTMQQVFDKILQTLDEEDIEQVETTLKDPKVSVAQKTNLLLDCLQKGVTLIVLDNFEAALTETSITDPDLKAFIETVCETQHDTKLIITSRRNLEIDTYAKETIHLDEGLDASHSIEFLRKLADKEIEKIANATDKELKLLSEKVHGVPMALRSLAGFLKKRRRLNIVDLLKDETRYEDFVRHDITSGLRKLIKEQYESLPDEAKLALQVLAVYNAPVQPVAVQYILLAIDTETVLDSLAFDYFLVQEHHDYFELHPTVQEYAYEQIPHDGSLAESPNNFTRPTLHARVADFHTQFEKPESEWKTITDLQPHLEEFNHCIKAGQYDRAARLMGAIDFGYLQVWGYSQMVAELRKGLIGKLTDKILELTNYNNLGSAYWEIGNEIEAIPMHEKALQIAINEKYKWGEEFALTGLGNICVDFLADIPRAIEFHTRSLTIAREMGNENNVKVSLANLGYAYYALATQFPDIDWRELPIKMDFDDPLQAAIQYLEQALENAIKMDYKIGKGIRSGYLGEAYLQKYIIESSDESLQKAIESHQNALQFHNEIGFAQYIPKEYKRLGVDYLFASEIGKAFQCFQSCVEEGGKVLPKTQLYVVLYQMALSQLALECLGVKEFSGLGIKAYQKAMEANSSPGILREQIYEIERLQQILSQIKKNSLYCNKPESLENLVVILALLRERLKNQKVPSISIELS